MGGNAMPVESLSRLLARVRAVVRLQQLSLLTEDVYLHCRTPHFSRYGGPAIQE